MKVKDGFVISNVGDKTVAVASGALCREFSGMITLNGTGKMMFEMLQRETTEEEMAQALVSGYGISFEQAARDVRAFLSSLEKAGLLV